ncbi:MAG: ABC-type transport auxiliary lipoprotein family protein [Hyphomicrobiales bacterium]
MTTRIVKLGLALLSLSLVTACMQRPPARLVVMAGQGTAAQISQTPKASIGEPIVSVPEYLDTYDVLIRTSPFSLKADSNLRWAEKPASALARLIAENGIAAGFSTTEPADYEILVTVERFEPTREGIVVLCARWLVVDARNRKSVMIRGGDTFYRSVASGPDGRIAAMEAAGRDLAHEVIRSLPSLKVGKHR